MRAQLIWLTCALWMVSAAVGGVSGWGWEDGGRGAINRNGTLLRLPGGRGQTLRIQVREDGVSVDVVLSAVKYRTARPGTAKNDTTILNNTQH